MFAINGLYIHIDTSCIFSMQLTVYTLPFPAETSQSFQQQKKLYKIIHVFIAIVFHLLTQACFLD